MIQTLNIVNPITEKEEIVSIDINNYDQIQYDKYMFELKVNSIEMLLKYYINCLTPSLYKNNFIFNSIDSLTFKDNLAKIFRLLYKLNNQFEYNRWINDLILKYQTALILENNFKEIMLKEVNKSKVRTKTLNTGSKPKLKKIKNEWIKHETSDLFDNDKPIYLYENLATGERLESENPNMLKELNKKKKEKKVISFKFQF